MLEYQLGHIESLSSLIQDLDEDIKKNRIYKLGNWDYTKMKVSHNHQLRHFGDTF